MKTLKDFDKCRWSREGMTKEPDELGYGSNVWIHGDALRQSAIEDIKEMLKANDLTVEDIGNPEKWGFTSREMVMSVVDYIMKKFNITKEDLK